MTENGSPRPAVSVTHRTRRTLARAARRLGLRGGVSGAAQKVQQHDRVVAVLAASHVAAAEGPGRPELRLATAVGDRLATALALEVAVERLTGTSSALLQHPDQHPDLVLVEVDRGAVPGWSTGDLGLLADLVTNVGATGAPVNVWITGPEVSGTLDPELDRLLKSADHVWLADPTAVAQWRTRLPDTAVGVLLPGVQPRLHRPGPGGQLRAAAACALLDAPAADGSEPTVPLLAAPLPRSVARLVDVWRQVDASGQVRELPEALADRGVKDVDAATASVVPAAYRVLLDAGRGTPGATWSVLEAAASQTAVVTDRASAETLPPDLRELVSVAEVPQDLPGILVANMHQPELADRDALRLHRAVLRSHALGHRIDDLIRAGGQQPPARPGRAVSAVVPTNREHELDNILLNIGRQAHDQVQLVLVLHGLDIDEAGLRSRAADAGVGDLVLVRADAASTLGACMNLGVDASDGRYVAKMDDDNFYGTHYLGDLLASFDYTDAQIAGKWAHYVWLRSTGAVVLRHARSEHTYERRIQGGSMLFDGDLVREVRFSDIPRAVDSDILDRSMALGAKVYSADRFNYVSIRGTDRSAHTWTVADYTFMTPTGQLAFYGDPREHVDI